MQDLASGTASLRGIAALLRDACTSMDKAEAQAKAVVSREEIRRRENGITTGKCGKIKINKGKSHQFGSQNEK